MAKTRDSSGNPVGLLQAAIEQFAGVFRATLEEAGESVADLFGQAIPDGVSALVAKFAGAFDGLADALGDLPDAASSAADAVAELVAALARAAGAEAPSRDEPGIKAEDRNGGGPEMTEPKKDRKGKPDDDDDKKDDVKKDKDRKDKEPGTARRALDTLTDGVGALAKAASGARGVLDQFAGAVQGQVASLVQGFNPAAVNKFNLAMNDTRAALGEALVPLLGSLTVVMRGVGDVIASLSPQAKAVIGGLVGVGVGFTVVGVAIAAVSASLNSVTFGIPAIIGGLVGGFAALAVTMKPVGEVQELVRQAADALTPVLDALAASVGVAVRAFAPIGDAVLSVVGSLARTIGGVATRVGTLVETLAARMKPALDAVGLAVSRMADAFGETALAAVDALGAALEVLIPPLMDVLVPALQYAARQTALFAATLAGLADAVRELLGTSLAPAAKSTAGASVGKAVGQVNTGSVEDVIRRAQVAAFAGGGGMTDAQKLSGATNDLAKDIRDLKAEIKLYREWAANKGRQIGQYADAAAHPGRTLYEATIGRMDVFR